MKNIHVLPTNKPSEFYSIDGKHKLANSTMAMDWYISSVGYKPQHIYITSDKEIKEGDWYISNLENEVYKATKETQNIMSVANLVETTTYKNTHFKIILTTDQDLIKDGVQSIDDEFLEWFVKNPSCKYAPIVTTTVNNQSLYKTNIGFELWRKEEPKQEGLSELEKLAIRKRKELGLRGTIDGFIAGYEIAKQQMYSEKDVRKAIDFIPYHLEYGNLTGRKSDKEIEEFINQFKKK